MVFVCSVLAYMKEKSEKIRHRQATDSVTGPEQGLINGRNSSIGRELQRMAKSSAGVDAVEGNILPQTKEESNQYVTPSFGNKTTAALIEEQNHKKALLQCLLLEMGILFHSVFIGMALSVAVGNDFIVLLIAITFHRKSLYLSTPIRCKSTYN